MILVYYLLSLLEAESKRNDFRIEVAVTLNHGGELHGYTNASLLCMECVYEL